MSIPYRVWSCDLKQYAIGNDLIGHRTLVPKEAFGPNATEDMWMPTLILALMGGPKLIAEQWSGDTDKAGTRIYDGDIVDGTDSNGWECPEDHYRVIVRYDPDRFHWVAKCPFSGDTYYLDDYGCLDRVVGNVRENPELVKVEEEQT